MRIALLTFVVCGCFAPKYGNGHLQCEDGSTCPSGFHCAADDTCWADGSDPLLDLSTSMEPVDMDLGKSVKHRGEPCSPGDGCDNSTCVDGYCCDSECTDACKACNLLGLLGTCSDVAIGGDPVGARTCDAEAPATCGRDGKCDGSGACRKYVAGSACSTPVCTIATGAFVPASQCDGAGTCVATPGYNCDPYKCQDATRCWTSCSAGSAECSGANSCNAGACGLLPDSRPCSADGQCLNGHCADGYCCNSGCNGSCQACDVVGKLGVCSTVTAGLPHGTRGCANQGTSPCGGKCNGVSADCSYADNSVTCGSACTDSTHQKVSLCDGAGACAQQAPTGCTNHLLCAGTGCLMTCGADTDCQPGFGCAGGSCVPHCSDGHKDADETDVDCGGQDCGACAVYKKCSLPRDCSTSYCHSNGICMPVSGAAQGGPVWQRIVDMPNTRNYIVGMTDARGRVYAWLGSDSSTGHYNSSGDVFDPSTGMWNASGLASNPVPMYGYAGATGPDGLLYICGGASSIPNDRTVSAYNTANNTWITPNPPAINVGRRFGNAVTAGPRIFLFGGIAQMGGVDSPTTDVESWAPGEASWSTMAAMPSARSTPASGLGIDGRIYVLGGGGGNTALIYDPAQNKWVGNTAPAAYNHDQGVFPTVTDGRMWAVQGTAVEAFAPSVGTWMTVAPLTLPRSRLGVAVGADGRLYAYGGDTDGVTPLKYAEAYGPTISLSTTSAARGATFTLTGSNFAHSAPVGVFFDSTTSPLAGGNISSSTGTLGTTGVTVPNSLSVGPHKVIVGDAYALWPAFAQVNVN